MNLLGISEGPALGHRPERFKRRFVTRNRPPALQFLDIAAYLADILSWAPASHSPSDFQLTARGKNETPPGGLRSYPLTVWEKSLGNTLNLNTLTVFPFEYIEYSNEVN